MDDLNYEKQPWDNTHIRKYPNYIIPCDGITLGAFITQTACFGKFTDICAWKDNKWRFQESLPSARRPNKNQIARLAENAKARYIK